ncbi:hypothetical protein [Spirosoma migulaei]
MEPNSAPETLSEVIRFRTRPKDKALVQSRANALNLSLSEYASRAVMDYDSLKQAVANYKTQAAKSTPTGPQPELLTSERVAKIRQLAVKDYQEQHLDKEGGKTPYMELNKRLTDRLKLYETKELKALFGKLKGQTALIKDAYGNTEEIKIEDMSDVVLAIVESFKVKILNEKA